jgi:hypothetical protein
MSLMAELKRRDRRETGNSPELGWRQVHKSFSTGVQCPVRAW